jgi:hypothetical protein
MRGIKEKYNGHSYFTSGFFRQNFPFLVSAASPEFFDLDHHNAYNIIFKHQQGLEGCQQYQHADWIFSLMMK